MKQYIEKGLGWLYVEKELLEKTRSEIRQINSVCREIVNKIDEYTEGKIEREVVIQTIKDSILLLSKLLTGLITPNPDLEFLELEDEGEVREWLEYFEEKNLKEECTGQIYQLLRILRKLEQSRDVND